MSRIRATMIWSALTLAIAVPILLATQSPYLPFRAPTYIAAGFAGIVALALLLVQPLLVTQSLPGLSFAATRRAHRVIGVGLVASVAIHVGGLWITSPPDVVDALTFTSPTPFSAWGVVAMWALFGTATLAFLRHKLTVQGWRLGHGAFAIVIVGGTLIHAVLIEGAMEQISKILLCVAVAIATLRALMRLHPSVLLKNLRRRL